MNITLISLRRKLRPFINTTIKIPFNKQYECKDFILKNNNFTKYSKKHITDIKITKINDIKIPFNEQYECKDF